jgi:ubiquitin-protein ligase
MALSRLTIKRITNELKIYHQEKNTIPVYNDPDNLLKIYFLIRGEKETPYENGEYLGLIHHNREYPIKAPDLMMLTPNGRFEVNKKICLTNTSYHQESWAPAGWNIRTFLEAFLSVWYSTDKSDKIGISHLNISNDKIIEYSKNSEKYNNNLNDKEKSIVITLRGYDVSKC